MSDSTTQRVVGRDVKLSPLLNRQPTAGRGGPCLQEFKEPQQDRTHNSNTRGCRCKGPRKNIKHLHVTCDSSGHGPTDLTCSSTGYPQPAQKSGCLLETHNLTRRRRGLNGVRHALRNVVVVACESAQTPPPSAKRMHAAYSMQEGRRKGGEATRMRGDKRDEKLRNSNMKAQTANLRMHPDWLWQLCCK
jgi:hypothetical protein